MLAYMTVIEKSLTYLSAIMPLSLYVRRHSILSALSASNYG